MVLELVSNTLSAMTLGYSTGIIVSVITIAQSYVIIELPLNVQLPTATMIIVAFGVFASLYAGAKYGTKLLYQKNIASILKGQ